MSDVVILALIALVAAVIAAVPPTIVALSARKEAIKSRTASDDNAVKLDQLEVKIDGRLERLLEITAQAKLAEGKLIGGDEARVVAAGITEPLAVAVVAHLAKTVTEKG